MATKLEMIKAAALKKKNGGPACPDWLPEDMWATMSAADKAEAIAKPDEYKAAIAASDQVEEDDNGNNETVAPVNLDSDDIHVKTAAAISSQFDAVFLAELNGTIDADEKVKRGAIMTRENLLRVLGKDGMASLPYPDSDPDDKNADGSAKWGNNPCDKYPTTKQNENGESSSVKGSLIADIFDTSVTGVTLQARIKALKEAGREGFVAPDWAAGLNEHQRLGQLNAATNRRSRGIALFKRGIKLHFQLAALDEMPLVDWEYMFVLDKDGNDTDVVLNTPKPIVLSTTGKPKDFKSVSASQVIGFNVDKAKAAGGKWSDLIKTGKRKKVVGGVTPTAAVTVINSIDRLDETFSEVEAALEDAKIVAQVYERMADDKDADFIRTVFKIASQFERFTAKPAMIARNLALIEAEMAAPKPETAQRAALKKAFGK